MNRNFLFPMVSAFLLILGRGPSMAGEPTEQIKQTTDKILSILADPNLKNPARAEERKQSVRRTIDGRFDWEELARRSLANTGTEDSGRERGIHPALPGIVGAHLPQQSPGLLGRNVRYEGESIEGNYATVKVRILTSRIRRSG